MATENRMVVARGWGKGGSVESFDGYEASVLQDGKVLETCYTTV